MRIFESLPKLVDWAEVYVDLKRHGYGPTRIGLAIGVSKSTVQMWGNGGSEPSWHLGTRLLHLWSVVVFKATPNANLLTPGAVATAPLK